MPKKRNPRALRRARQQKTGNTRKLTLHDRIRELIGAAGNPDLTDMLSLLGTGDIGGETDEILQVPTRRIARPAKRKKADRKLLKKWQQWAKELRNLHSLEHSVQEIDYRVHFTIECVLENGLIVANYNIEDESYRFFVRLGPDVEQRFACECIHSLGETSCNHTFTFSDWLSEMLMDEDSELSELIKSKSFHGRQPDLSQFSRPDDSVVKKYLDARLPRLSTKRTNDDASALGEIADVRDQRLCWDLIPSVGYPEMHLRLQKRKKRGQGWTKGKRVSTTNLVSCFHLTNDADRDVISTLHDHALYYGRSLEFNVVESCFRLIGQSNFSIAGNNAAIEGFQPELEYFETQTQCGVRLKTDPKIADGSFVAEFSNRLIQILPAASLVRAAELSDESLKAFMALQKLPTIPLSASAKLVEYLRAYRTLVAIDLPKNDSRSTPETTKPVLLLRSCKDGSLDYGFRLRGSQDNLYVPAAGPLLVTTGKGKKTNELIRDPNLELAQVRRAAQLVDLAPEPMEGSIKQFEPALDLLDKAQRLETDGQLEVLWDKASTEPVRMLGTLTPRALRVKVAESRDWFQLNGHAELEHGSLDLSELLAGISDSDGASPYIRFGKQGWAKVSRQLRKRLNRLADTVHRDRKKLNFDASSVPALKEILADNAELETSRKWKDCLIRIDRAMELQPQIPAGLKAELRQYQQEGYCWLRRLAEWGVGGVLADDMGLGKTLQTLAVLLDRSSVGPALVVAPTSVGFNWQSETQRFAPGLNAMLYRETDRDKFLEQVGPGDLVICSYGLLLRDEQKLAQIQWATFVLDEAQAVKNNRSKTAAAAKKIHADWKLALTGTPMENHLGELWSIFNVVAAGVFGGWENFRTRFATPIERHQDDDRRLALRDRIQPFILRRTKSEVLKDLPPRSEQNLVIELSPEERKIYDSARLSALGEVDEISNLPLVQDQRFRLLALLTRLRQLACSPRLLDAGFNKRSSKLQQLAETVIELQNEGHCVLIFSQFVKHLSLIREMLEAENVSFEYLDGSTPAAARRERVERFQDGSATAFLISLKAGGTGLNLTAADYVIHMDPWWNPAVEDQATDRAHRIGQKRSVMCYRFVSKGTIEEEILKLHASKRDLVSGVLEGTSAAAKLSTLDLIDLIRQ